LKKLKQAGDYSIFQKRSGRCAVQNKQKKWVNGEEKTKILLDAGLIRITPPKPPEPGQTEEPASEEGAEQSESRQGD